MRRRQARVWVRRVGAGSGGGERQMASGRWQHMRRAPVGELNGPGDGWERSGLGGGGGAWSSRGVRTRATYHVRWLSSYAHHSSERYETFGSLELPFSRTVEPDQSMMPTCAAQCGSMSTQTAASRRQVSSPSSAGMQLARQRRARVAGKAYACTARAPQSTEPTYPPIRGDLSVAVGCMTYPAARQQWARLLLVFVCDLEHAPLTGQMHRRAPTRAHS